MGLNLPPPQAATPGGKDVIKGLRTFVQNLGIGTSLVGELRSHMPHGQETQNIKQKQYRNTFNRDLKNGIHKKNLKNKTESLGVCFT